MSLRLLLRLGPRLRCLREDGLLRLRLCVMLRLWLQGAGHHVDVIS
jgi:hypothetical protein